MVLDLLHNRFCVKSICNMRLHFRAIKYIAAGISVISGVMYLYFNNPETTRFMPKCIFHEVTGLFCPGCGTGRAFYAFLHGNILQALSKNIILFPVLLLLILFQIKPDIARKKVTCHIILWGTVMYWILRNVPYFPFTLLQPV